MITHVATHNDKLYDALFADITASITNVTVRTLEEYFMNLEAIARYVIGTSPSDAHPDKTYFLRLPVDENMVVIDANSRNIVLSDAYRKNGVAVVGDTYAETLWFQIDRYYDLQDLSLTNIFIFWELPNKAKGYSQPAFKDIHSEGGKLIFSWTIPELLTETAGNIKFYVSFQTANEDYVFNTLPQTAKINATLEAKLSDTTLVEDEVDSSKILSRLHNTTNIGTIVVSRPLISSCTSSADVELFTSDGDTKDIEIYAYSTDNAAVLTYTLYKNGENTRLTSTDCFKITEDIEVNPHKIYYNEDGTALDSTQLTNPKDSAAREKGKRFVVSAVGSYQCKVIATITIGSEPNTIQNTSAPAYTHRWVWETPTEFTIKENTAVFKNNPSGIIYKGADHIDDQKLVITWPSDSKDSVQQQAAIYSAEISIAPVEGAVEINPQTIASNNNSSTIIEIGNPFVDEDENLVVGTSEVTIKFNKTLNKVQLPASNADRPEIKLTIQSEAKPYDATNITISDVLIQTGSSITTSLDASSLVARQEYFYCWQRQSGGNWADATNLVKIADLSAPTFTDSFRNSGTYRLKFVAKFGADQRITYSTDANKVVTVYSVSA